VQFGALRTDEIEPGIGGGNSEVGVSAGEITGGQSVNAAIKIKKRAGGAPAVPRLRLACAIVTFFAMVVSTFAADTAAFDTANKLYEQGKFAEAAAAYKQMIQSGTVSSAVYFNLGNAYFKAGQLGQAIAAIREAENLTPRDPDVRANLQFIRAKVQAPTGAPATWQQWLTTLTLNEWAILTAAIVWLWLGLWIVIQFRPKLAQSVRPLLWCGGAAILLCGGCMYAAWTSESTKTAIVVAKDVILHNGPLDEAPTAATVHDGAELNVLDTKNDWLQVRVDNQRVGWLKREQVIVASGA
jgi:Flp pilus assembly protein TadD